MQEETKAVNDAQEATQNAQPSAEEMAAHGLNTDDSLAGGLNGEGQPEDGSAAMEAELAEAKDKYLRLAAEFDNYKRRMSKECSELFLTAGRDVLQSLLPVLDDMDRATKTLEGSGADVAAVKEGVMLVFNKLRSTLQGRGLKAMDSTGQPFDAELHEAITEVPVPNDAQRGTVIDTIEPGYYLNDKLIRHAKVVVGK